MLKRTPLIVLSLSVFIAPANALDLRLQPRFKTGTQYYEFEQPEYVAQGKYPDSQSGIQYSGWLPFISSGATFFVDRFFVDVDVQYMFAGEGVSNFSGRNHTGENNKLEAINHHVVEHNSRLDADFDRFEWAVSAGFEVIDGLVVYGGYKHAETNFKGSLNGSISGSQVGGLNLTNPFLTGSTEGLVDLDFEYDGPFVGLNYGWKVNQGFLEGALSFNFAVAFLESKTRLNLSGVNIRHPITGDTILPFDELLNTGEVERNVFKGIEGSSTGYSFGLGWQGLTPVNGLTYLMGVDGYHYEFTGNKAIENTVRVNFGLAYAFDF
jgi:hypothetical protein